eukprot:scaffold13722_cov26-Tisochrysis_lutea.AAC.1
MGELSINLVALGPWGCAGPTADPPIGGGNELTAVQRFQNARSWLAGYTMRPMGRPPTNCIAALLRHFPCVHVGRRPS